METIATVGNPPGPGASPKSLLANAGIRAMTDRMATYDPKTRPTLADAVVDILNHRAHGR